MQSSFSGKTAGNTSGQEYDFLTGVFEWVFYSLPPRADNTFIKNMFDFYKTRGGLSKKQLEALLKTIQGIDAIPPFNPATIEAIIRKKGTKSKSPLPPASPMYQDDAETRGKLEQILLLAPAHKAALLYINKLNLHELITPADKDSINKFFTLVTAAKAKQP